jgi:hypothetical protein
MVDNESQPNNLRSRTRILLVALSVGWLLVGLAGCSGKKELARESPEFAPEVEKVLQDKVYVLNQLILAGPGVIESIRESNRRNQGIAMPQIQKLNEHWRASGEFDGLVNEVATGEISRLLMEFQDSHEGYSEIFITDATGLIVALTNKTNDYYQADQEWWIKTYNGAQGTLSHGDLEVDQRAMSEAIAIYLPIADPETMTSIGVMKVLIDVVAIKMAL